jgi:hypothetical protein
LLRAAKQVNAVSLAFEFLAVISFSTSVVPDLDHTVLSAGKCHVVGIRHSHVSNSTRVVLKNYLG